jgi:TetR/AcrR family transcriptional regulator
VATRDPEATKQRILDAALREFSDKGIAGARVDAIAARANVNKRMLYYYFGSKEGLFREILQRRIDESSFAFRDSDVAGRGRLARRQADVARDRDYVRLMAWEALECGATHPVDDSPRRELFKRWIEAVEAEQRAGNVPPELDAAQLVLSELCLVLGPLMVPQMTRLITGCGPTSPKQLERRAAFLDALERRIEAPQHVAG